jgi:cytochrome c553
MRRLAVLALVGCEAAGAGGKPKLEHDTSVRLHMHENFDLLRAIEKLVVRGRLDEAKAFAKSIAEAPDEPGLGAFTEHTIRVRQRAHALSQAKTADEAARLEAQLAAACAGCHEAAGVVPEFTTTALQAPPDEPTVQARMSRHLWATDRLWEGIVGGAEEPWQQGLDVLAAAPLDSPQITGERLAIAKRLQQLAATARMRKGNDTTADRARVYGEMLSTCAACHGVP